MGIKLQAATEALLLKKLLRPLLRLCCGTEFRTPRPDVPRWACGPACSEHSDARNARWGRIRSRGPGLWGCWCDGAAVRAVVGPCSATARMSESELNIQHGDVMSEMSVLLPYTTKRNQTQQGHG